MSHKQYFSQSMTSSINLFTIKSIKNMSQFYCEAQLFTPSGLNISPPHTWSKKYKSVSECKPKSISRRYLNGSDKKCNKIHRFRADPQTPQEHPSRPSRAEAERASERLRQNNCLAECMKNPFRTRCVRDDECPARNNGLFGLVAYYSWNIPHNK